jgi:hypothetical protein
MKEDEKESTTVFQAQPQNIQSLATVGIQHSYGRISPQVRGVRSGCHLHVFRFRYTDKLHKTEIHPHGVWRACTKSMLNSQPAVKCLCTLLQNVGAIH